MQHKLLLFTAEHCEDTMEHCRLLLLLLQRFPTAISSNGVRICGFYPNVDFYVAVLQPRLADTLISAEKHSVDGYFPVNSYRKMLICDLLPLLSTEDVSLYIPTRMLPKLLDKAIEFYLSYIGQSAVQVRILKKEVFLDILICLCISCILLIKSYIKK